MNFAETASNGSRDMKQKALCSSIKLPLIIGRSQNNISFVAHAWRVRDKNFQENPSNGRRDIAEKVHYSPCNYP